MTQPNICRGGTRSGLESTLPTRWSEPPWVSCPKTAFLKGVLSLSQNIAWRCSVKEVFISKNTKNALIFPKKWFLMKFWKSAIVYLIKLWKLITFSKYFKHLFKFKKKHLKIFGISKKMLKKLFFFKKIV